jgi:hypothetical protein
MSSERNEGDFSLTEPESAPPGQGSSGRVHRDSETVGESSGGVLGAAAGMSIGAMGGPVGLVLGGLAGAVGGWWAGRGIADAMTKNDDDALRRHFERLPDRPADRSYEDVRAAYVAGHLAGKNPEYARRSFDEVEPELRRGWGDDVVRQCGEWPSARRYAQAGFERARGATPPPTDERR